MIYIPPFYLQSFLVGMLNLGERDMDLFQLLKQVKYQPSDLHSGRLKHISLPQCTNKQARASFEAALCGVFSELWRLWTLSLSLSLSLSLWSVV